MSPPLVTIICLVYNHEPYLRKCLDGFVMQKTTFPFEAIVHDDASTDGSTKIIRDYVEKYPNIIKSIYEVKNLYGKGIIGKKIDAAMHACSKYIAFCEGDDYWIDPFKLQKQVDFLETHPDYTMCCNRTKLYSEHTKSFIGENFCYDISKDIETKDIIYRTGLFISTCSILYKKNVKDNYPDYCKQCVVGDYPSQIMCAMKGKTYYFNEAMSVYRVQNSSSWMGRQKWSALSESNIKRIHSMLIMFHGFACDYPKFKKEFNNKIAEYINTTSPSVFEYPVENVKYFNLFRDYTQKYSLFWKVDKFFRTHANVFSRFYILHVGSRLVKKYYPKNRYYD